jgi:glycosyltransferase involved in cell wall biosynthesis
MGETAGYCAGLVVGLRALGLRADHLDLGHDPMRYAIERPPVRARVVRWLAARRRSGPGPRAAWTLLHRAAMAGLLLHAIARYDAFVFRAGDSFLGLRDLALLRRLGKPVLVVFFGSDSRPSYLNGAEVARGPSGAALAAETAAKRRMVERIERDGGAIVCHIMSAQLHSRRAVAFLAVGIPRTSPEAAQAPPEGPIRVLHAPSLATGKGTETIRRAVDAVRAAGVSVELEVISGRSNHEVLRAIEGCHFVIDQLYSDTPMAGFAAEAAALGRPAIVGGLGWDEVRAATPPDMLPPAHVCHPDELAEAIARLATDHAYRAALGERARAFVRERWSPAAVASRLVDVLRGQAPAEWWFEPAAIVYAGGAGQPLDGVAGAVRAVIEAVGAAALQVGDKPVLERRLVELATRDLAVTAP